MGPKIRVLVVDDAVVIRKMISEVISRDPALEVAGVAANGHIALQKLTQVNPDVVTLDVEMPELDGLETVREIRKTHPHLPVIMFSTLTQRGAETTLDALRAGATDYVTKPANVASFIEGMQRLQSELIPRIKSHCRKKVAPISPTIQPPGLRATSPVPETAVTALCIGSSTGGPNALADIFGALLKPVNVPVLIVQHMPPVFTRILAERLGKLSGLPSREATEGEEILPGNIYVAPGGLHFEVASVGHKVWAHLHDGPQENSCRPAVDVLFRSAARCYGAGVLAVVLTGMGQDGMRGSQVVRAAGGRVLAQDEATSVVWGMPGSVAQAGLAEAVLPLPDFAGELSRRLRGRGR